MKRVAIAAVGVALVIIASSCGGSGSPPKSTVGPPPDLAAAWATRVKFEVDRLRASHLDPNSYSSDLDAAYSVAKPTCDEAIDALNGSEAADPMRLACEAMDRAAGTPAISAAAIYEIAYDHLTAVGSTLDYSSVSTAARRYVAGATLLGFSAGINDSNVPFKQVTGGPGNIMGETEAKLWLASIKAFCPQGFWECTNIDIVDRLASAVDHSAFPDIEGLGLKDQHPVMTLTALAATLMAVPSATPPPTPTPTPTGPAYNKFPTSVPK